MAVNAAKTHCDSGHSYADEGVLYISHRMNVDGVVSAAERPGAGISGDLHTSPVPNRPNTEPRKQLDTDEGDSGIPDNPTPIPQGVDLTHLRALVRQKRDEGLATIMLMLDDVDSMIIEVEAFRNRYDAASRRQKDAAKARRQIPPKLTLANVNQYDESPDG